MADNLNLLNFKFGSFKNLPADKAAGTVYVTTDEQAMYIDLPNDQGVVNRLRLGDIIVQESARTSQPPYAEGAIYYFVAENALLRYSNNEWVQINKETDLSTLTDSLDALSSRVTNEIARLEGIDTGFNGRIEALEGAIVNKLESSVFEAFKTENTGVINGVKTIAEKGVTDAENAQKTADAANAAATNAQADATKGIEDAAKAQAAAEKAQADATKGIEDAAKAQARADLGVTNAATAQATAETAQGSADTAQARADAAYDLADGKTTMAAVEGVLASYATKEHVNTKIADIQGGDLTHTINDAYQLAVTAKSNAEAAQNTADLKTTMGEVQDVLKDYATSSDLATEKAALLGNSNSSADSLTIHGLKKAVAAAAELGNDGVVAAAVADGKAVAAQNTADAAARAAATADEKAVAADSKAVAAQKDATQGINDAAKAQGAAENAQKAADDAATEATKAKALANAAQDTADAANAAAATADGKAVAAQAAADAAAALAAEKLALTGGKMASSSANIDMNGATVTNLKAPSANSDAATKAYVDAVSSTHNTDKQTLQGNIDAVSTVANNALPKAGGEMVANAEIKMNGGKITGLATPTADADAANKAFVESTVASAIAANDAMTFKGVVDCGQDGGTTTKPADANANRGDTWKVGRAGTYAGIVAKVGDLLIYEGDDGTKDASKWAHISSGYEDDYLQKFFVDGNSIYLNDGISSSIGGFEVVGGNNLHIEVEEGTGTAPIHKIKASLVWGTF